MSVKTHTCFGAGLADIVTLGAGSAIGDAGDGFPLRGGGTHSLRSLSDATEDLGVRLQGLGSGISIMSCRFYMYPVTVPTTTTNELYQSTWYILSSIEATGLMPMLIWIGGGADDGKLGVIEAVGGAGGLHVGNTVLTLDDFEQRIEWRIKANGDVQVLLNGATEIDYNDTKLSTFSWMTVGGLGLSNSTSTGGDAYFTDVLARDDSVWPGAGQGRVFPAFADSALGGGYTGWVPLVGPADHDDVDDAIPIPNDADYINSTTANMKGTVKPDTAANLGIDGVIHAIQPLVRGGCNVGDGGDGYKTLANINGDDTVSTQLNYTTPTWLSKQIPAILSGPYAAANWDTVEGGCQKGAGTNESRVFTVWFSVDWQPSATGPEVYTDHDFIAGSHAYQPDAAAGVDAHISDGNPDANFGTNAQLSIGDIGGKAAQVIRALISFDTSGDTAGNTVRQARLCLAVSVTSNALTIRASKILPAWEETPVTWNRWRVGDNWTTPGCEDDGTDYDSTYEHDTAMAGSPSAGVFEYLAALDIVDNAKATVSRIRLRSTNESATVLRNYHSSDGATARLRPLLVVQVDEAAPPSRRKEPYAQAF